MRYLLAVNSTSSALNRVRSLRTFRWTKKRSLVSLSKRPHSIDIRYRLGVDTVPARSSRWRRAGGRAVGRADRRTNKQTNEWTNGWTNGHFSLFFFIGNVSLYFYPKVAWISVLENCVLTFLQRFFCYWLLSHRNKEKKMYILTHIYIYGKREIERERERVK